MNTSGIINSISKYVPLDEVEQLYITSLLLPLKIRQGEFTERTGNISKGMIYVNAGCLMTYFSDKQATDHVIQFATAGWWTGDLHSFTSQTPSIYSTKALADSEVLLLPKNDMDQLLERFPKFERYFRIIFQNSLVTHQHRIIQNFSVAAEERYVQFQEKYPSLEQYVPLKYIASYLGITPEFLSKIRRRRSEK
jgi:CRP-like cAMP-binding protein